MTYKAQQVLRTKVPLRGDGGTQISPNTRVVVMRMVDTDKVRVKVADSSHENLARTRIVAGVGAFNSTHRGRPRKDS
jgi:hypothetical protein